MIGITSAQTAAWTYMLGTGLAGAAYMAPAGGSLIKMAANAIADGEGDFKYFESQDSDEEGIGGKKWKKYKADTSCKQCKGTKKGTDGKACSFCEGTGILKKGQNIHRFDTETSKYEKAGGKGAGLFPVTHNKV